MSALGILFLAFCLCIGLSGLFFALKERTAGTILVGLGMTLLSFGFMYGSSHDLPNIWQTLIPLGIGLISASAAYVANLHWDSIEIPPKEIKNPEEVDYSKQMLPGETPAAFVKRIMQKNNDN